MTSPKGRCPTPAPACFSRGFPPLPAGRGPPLGAKAPGEGPCATYPPTSMFTSVLDTWMTPPHEQPIAGTYVEALVLPQVAGHRAGAMCVRHLAAARHPVSNP